MDLAAVHGASQRAFFERFGTRVERPHGSVVAAVSPQSPDRSLPNSVAYEDPADVLAALPELARIYDDAGVRAWTVWVKPEHPDLARELEAAGHAFDGRPMRMGAPLAEIDLSAELDAEVTPLTDWRVAGELNDAAYGVSGLTESFGRFSGADSRGWLASLDGRPAATVTVLEHEGDAFVIFVATAPDARGRGLCRGLMSHALRVAAEHGCTTTTLEGSPMGEPIYARMGYRSLGRFGLWERRLRNDSA